MIIFLFLLQVSATNVTDKIFCSSFCADYIGACYGPNSNECWACASSLYNLQRNASMVCQTKPQHQVAFYELKNDAMDLSGYSSSKPTPLPCDQYTLSGQYVAGDFIQKTFTGLPLNHYQVVVRFGVGYIGSWNPTDQMHLEINGQVFTWTYNTCYYPQDLCGSSVTECIKIVERVISHDVANLTVRFSSSISETNPVVKFWGIKDLTIGIRTCSSRC